MASQLQQPAASTAYTSLLSPAEFSHHVQQLSYGAQLDFCQSIFHANILVEQKSHELVYQACNYIQEHKLWIYVEKTESEYWQDVEYQYGVASIMETERRKQKARCEIQAVWNGSLDACLGTRTPPNPSRTLLEQLARFAKMCGDVSVATKLLEDRIECRVARSRRTEHIIVRDVESAIDAWQLRQKRENITKRREMKAHKPNHVPSNPRGSAGVKPRAQPPIKQDRSKRSRQQITEPIEENSESLSELSDYNSSMFERSDEEAGMEDESYTQILKQSLPHDISDFQQMLQEELRKLRQSVPSGTWGATNVGQIYRILMRAKPATVYVSNVPQGIRYGLHTTSSRENADVLSLDDAKAGEALAEGPPDGKPILIRDSNDHRSHQPQHFLDAMDRYCLSDFDVQDPTIASTNSKSFRKMSPTELTAKFREVLGGTKTSGYTDNQLPPYNCLSLPSMSASEPRCLAKTEALRLDHLLRIWNLSTKPTLNLLSWSNMAMHLAISLPHQDHDGKGTLSHQMFGYKVCIFWPRMTDTDRSRFLEEGMSFAGRGARYLIIAPGDQFIQTPCCSQDVHAVINLGYCGVSRCTEECIRSRHPRCCGLAGVDGTHYRHARYTADSVNSAHNELLSDVVSNKERDRNFMQWLDQVEKLANRDEAFLGGSEACARFQQAKHDYLQALRK